MGLFLKLHVQSTLSISHFLGEVFDKRAYFYEAITLRRQSITHSIRCTCDVLVVACWAAKAAELNRHTTRMKTRGSVVS